LIHIVCGFGVVGDIQSELPNSNASAALLRPAGKTGGWVQTALYRGVWLALGQFKGGNWVA
jgi:hypothetical protein